MHVLSLFREFFSFHIVDTPTLENRLLKKSMITDGEYEA